MINTILWDIDGTLLNFEAAEDVCIHLCLAKQNASINEEQLTEYKRINRSFWNRFEKGEITKEGLYPGRFAAFFEYLGRPELDPVKMNADYQNALAENPVPEEGAMEVLTLLRGHYRQYVVTNGSLVAQTGKLKKTGIGAIMDGVFISEAIGAQKPSAAFFDYCAAAIPEYDPAKTVIIGDSLTSDIAGGVKAGIHCILFDPTGKSAQDVPKGCKVVDRLEWIPEVLESF